MAANRKGIMDIRQLLQLKIKGLSNRKIEGLLDMHRNTINEYVKQFDAQSKSYEELIEMSDSELSDLFTRVHALDKSRYEVLSGHFDHYKRELEKPGCTRKKLWEKYISMYPEGYRHSQFNEHLNRHLKAKKISGKLIHKAGEKIFIDYAGKKLHYVDKETGELIDVEVLVGILPCSMMTYGVPNKFGTIFLSHFFNYSFNV